MNTDYDSSAVTAALMDRFNDVFLRHDPTALPGLIAENCVIEKISPAPNGDRCIGGEACIALWTEIATTPGSHFDLEETFVMGDRRHHPLALLEQRHDFDSGRQFDACERRSYCRGDGLCEGRLGGQARARTVRAARLPVK